MKHTLGYKLHTFLTAGRNSYFPVQVILARHDSVVQVSEHLYKEMLCFIIFLIQLRDVLCVVRSTVTLQ